MFPAFSILSFRDLGIATPNFLANSSVIITSDMASLW